MWEGKVIAIVGGANSAGQAATMFARRARKVYILARSPLHKEMSAYLIHLLKEEESVEILEGIHLERIDPLGVTLRIHFLDHASIEVSAMFIFIGADPRTSWMPLQKDEHGYLLTGYKVQEGRQEVSNRQRELFPLETSIPGVFAAGDVRAGSIKRVASAVGEGSAAVAEIHQYLALLSKEER